MSNVVKFPKRGPLAPPELSRLKAALPSASTVKSLLAVLSFLVRLPLFLVLYWLRLPVMLLCNVVSIPTLGLFLFSWYAWPQRTHMVVGFGVLSFGAFAILWFYDALLMAIAPQEMVRML